MARRVSAPLPAPASTAGAAYRVWDLPTRLFHALLALLIAAQYASAELRWLPMAWHYGLGYATLVLLLFRLLWGLVGSPSSRFRAFVHGPVAVLRYARAALRGAAPASAGHNPLGGWSVLALLASGLVQALSGLMTSDDIDEAGPLVDAVPLRWVARMSAVHALNRWVLLGLIALHLGAIAVHSLRDGGALVAAMWHGRKRLAQDPQLRFAGLGRALAVLVLAAAAVAALLWIALAAAR